jgi:hypothetical protein
VTMSSTWFVARLLAGFVASTSAPSPIPVVVDATVVDGDGLRARLASGLQPLAPLLSATPETSVAFLRVGGELLDFEVGLALAPERGTTWSRCQCTHAELVAHVQRRIVHALRPRPAPPPPPRTSAALLPAAPPDVEIHRHGLGRRGRLGVVLVGLGGLTLGGGGVMVGASLADAEQWRPRVELRSFGVSVMTVGASALTTGVLLLIFDRRPFRSRPPAARS